MKQSGEFPLNKLCSCLGVSLSGYNAFRKSYESRDPRKEGELLSEIELIFRGSRNTYGSPRIHRILRKNGHKIGVDKVARLMARNKIRAKTKRKFRIVTTESNHKLPVAENKLSRLFSAERPGEKLTGDITYIETKEGWLYLAVVLDLYSRKIVGYAMDSQMKTTLVNKAFLNAVRSLEPFSNSVFHSDRGVQYASYDFREKLKIFGYDQSMSRRANCWDNSVTESFFATLKKEIIFEESFKTREEAKRRIFEWIECFYNSERIHSSIEFLTPNEKLASYKDCA